MKTWIKALVVALCCAPLSLFAQKSAIKLVCPLQDAVVVPPSPRAMQFDPPDHCIVLTTSKDSLVRACVDALVTNVETDENGKYGLVIFCKYNSSDYYFWYTGLDRLVVKKGDHLKAGQTVGKIQPGGNIELLMYDFETPLDPLKYMDCRSVQGTE